MNKFLRRIALVDTSGLSAQQRDTLINKINELNQDHHFMKFNLLTHPEFLAQSPKEEEQVDYIRKVDYDDSSSTCALALTSQSTVKSPPTCRCEPKPL